VVLVVGRAVATDLLGRFGEVPLGRVGVQTGDHVDRRGLEQLGRIRVFVVPRESLDPRDRGERPGEVVAFDAGHDEHRRPRGPVPVAPLAELDHPDVTAFPRLGYLANANRVGVLPAQRREMLGRRGVIVIVGGCGASRQQGNKQARPHPFCTEFALHAIVLPKVLLRLSTVGPSLYHAAHRLTTYRLHESLTKATHASPLQAAEFD
jgi:hypothetical protein